MLNKAILMGRLVVDPELKQTPNGVSVTGFRIAVNRTYNRELTDWIDIVAWRQNAEFVCKYFKKGDCIIVEGSIQTRSYLDKKDNKRTAVEVVAEQIQFAGSKTTKNDTNSNSPVSSQQDIPNPPLLGNMDDYEELNIDDGDLPF